MRQSHIAVIGAPMDLGAGRRGVDMGPSALRIAVRRPSTRTSGAASTVAGTARFVLTLRPIPGSPGFQPQTDTPKIDFDFGMSLRAECSAAM